MEKENYKEYFVYTFLGGVLVLTILCFFIKVDSFSNGLIIVFVGSILISILYGSLLILTNKYVRPRIQKHFLNHKNIKSLAKLDIYLNDTMNCHFGTYRNFDVQVLCHFDTIDVFQTEYVINIFFEKIDSNEVKRIRKKENLDRNNIAEFFIQQAFTFTLIPPSDTKLIDSINDFINILERNELKPVRLKDLDQEFNKMA